MQFSHCDDGVQTSRDFENEVKRSKVEKAEDENVRIVLGAFIHRKLTSVHGVGTFQEQTFVPSDNPELAKMRSNNALRNKTTNTSPSSFHIQLIYSLFVYFAILIQV